MIQNSLTKSIKMKTIIKAKKLNGQKKIEEDIKSKNSSNLYLKKDNNSSILKHLNDSKCEKTDKKKCRICFENKSQNLPLISPCLCEGSIKYVHQNCLKKWLIKSNIKPELAKCEICKYKYGLRFFKDKKFDRVSFRKFIFYIICLFIGLILIFFFLIICLYQNMFEEEEKKKKSKQKFLIISICSSLVIIIIICFIIFLYYYKECTFKTFENFEVLNRTKNEPPFNSFTMAISKNPFFQFKPTKIQFNNFFSTNILNISYENTNK